MNKNIDQYSQDHQIPPSILKDSNIYPELKPIIDRVKKQNIDIERETGLGRSTIWRWENAINNYNPDPDKVLKILRIDSKLNTVFDIAKHYGGAVEKFLKMAFPSQVQDNIVINKDFELINDQYEFYIYYICDTKRGATEDELINTIGNIALKKATIPKEDITSELIKAYGQIAIRKIKSLIDKKIIAKNVEGFYLTTHGNTQVSVENGYDRAHKLISDFFKEDDLPKGTNVTYTYQESIPKSLAIEIASEYRQFYQKQKEKLNKYSSSDKNSVPFVISVYAERLCFDTNLEEEVLQ